jgi:hypothetical protein
MSETSKNSQSEESSIEASSSLIKRYQSDYRYDVGAHDDFIVDYDSYEAMLISKTFDQVTKETKNGITDGSTATLYIERSARVVGQLPTGEFKAAGRKDAGKGALLDILWQKYIMPNANAQHAFLTKSRMKQLYSSVYGNMTWFVDWHVAPNGYIGPDCWLWNPRNFIPQNGRNSIMDMDYCHAISYVGVPYLEELLEDEEGDWDKEVIQDLIDLARDNTEYKDTKRDTYVKRQRQNQDTKGQIALATRYEAGHCKNCEDGDSSASHNGHWVTFAPKFGHKVLRDISNPHKTGRIPFFNKPGLPLFDSFYGLGDFQRARPIQFAKDGLTNFYFEGLKMNIYPPTVINANGVVKSSVDMRPGAVWMETIPNSVRRLETSTAGLSTYQAAISQLQASLQSQAGTTDTTVSNETSADSAMGKTPEALKKIGEREGTRDNQDRYYAEQDLEETANYMMQLFINMGTETVDIDLFSDEIQDIAMAGYTDILESLDISKSGQSAKIKIKPADFRDLAVKFQLHPGTTAAEDNSSKKEALENWFGIVGKMQNELETIRNQGQQIDWKAAFDMYGEFASVPEMNKLWKKVTPQEQQAEAQSMQSEAMNKPKVDYRIMGDMSPNEVASVMTQNGTPSQPGLPQQQMMPGGQPTGATMPAANQMQGPSIMQGQPDPMHPVQQPLAPPHPMNSSDPMIRAAAEHINQFARR